ncbi:DUF6678 family protein [Hymenobacter guriensis]|uniref:Uncharacterized protein n=1 Tax=Hymenobacter guriensis TaxID=2793065 RepID=A0ABS0KYQ1_9BACT|nr:DUF6678 family protein [Hymenobacter guriensis]MBG8552478.1 hypothetical protein [Hymenobacter guriensis]
MDKLIVIQSLIERTCCKIRLKSCDEDLPTEWRGGSGLPVPGYIEVSGPERIADVEWIEFDPIVITHIGRLVPPKVTVVIDDIIQGLKEEEIDYQVVKGIIRISGKELQ